MAQLAAAKADPVQQLIVSTAVERLALIQAINEAWGVIAVLTAISIASLLIVSQPRTENQKQPAS